MAIRINKPSGPEPMPDLRSLLAERVATIEGGDVICPHCLKYQEKFRGKSGPHVCQLCGKTFHLLKRGRWTFLTSKTEINRGEMHP